MNLAENSQEEKQSWISGRKSKQPGSIHKPQTPVELTTRCSRAVFLQKRKKTPDELVFYLNGLGVSALINIKIIKLCRGSLGIIGQNINHWQA